MLAYMNSLVSKVFAYWFSLEEKLRFVLVGGYNTVFAYAVFCLFQIVFGKYLNYIIILAITNFVSVINSFFNFKIFVFRSKQKVLPEFIRAVLVYFGYFCCNAILLFVIKNLGVNLFLSQFICVVILTVAVYFSHKYFSFKQL